MKTISIATQNPSAKLLYSGKSGALTRIKDWLKEQEPRWEYNRLGIVSTGVFLQVTFAGAMIGILGMAGASPFAYSIGIFFSFMANSLAFAQCPMRWVLGVITLSIAVNSSLILCYGLPMI